MPCECGTPLEVVILDGEPTDFCPHCELGQQTIKFINGASIKLPTLVDLPQSIDITLHTATYQWDTYDVAIRGMLVFPSPPLPDANSYKMKYIASKNLIQVYHENTVISECNSHQKDMGYTMNLPHGIKAYWTVLKK